MELSGVSKYSMGMIEIIQLLPAEALRFRSIRLRCLKENPEAFGTTFETANTWDLPNWVTQVERLKTFIATISGNDVGVARIAKDEKNPEIAWVISMWVAPEARGRKVATQLLQTMIQWATERGVTLLKLDVVDSNTAAIALYKYLGFKPNGVTGSFPEPRAHITEHQMELGLGELQTRHVAQDSS